MRRDDITQFLLPVATTMTKVDAASITVQPSMTRALQLCQTISGKDDAQFYGPGGIVKDQAQWSRIMGPSNHNFPHEKLNTFMDLAGNEVPMLWLLHSRGYDIERLHKLETKLERENRLLRENNEVMRRFILGVI